jgi:hypothetical protein
MPLHDWNRLHRWDGFHTLWISELLRFLRPRLPEGYRAYLGTAPRIALDEPEGNPDMTVRQGPVVPPPDSVAAVGTGSAGNDSRLEPDEEVMVAVVEPELPTLFVSQEGWLVAALELVSPRKKHRHSAQRHYTERYAGYLLGRVHLVLIDVHPRPHAFSFADEIANELRVAQPPVPAPLAVAYRVGEPMPDGGSLVGFWRRPLTVGQPLPFLPLPLNVNREVVLDLEATYMRAADDSYLN